MVNLALLENLFKNASSKTKPVNSSEEYFDQIVSSIEQEKASDAAKMIEKVFVKGDPDIRLIMYYFYAHFTAHGIKSFLETFPSIISIINDQWDVLTPQNKKDTHLQSSLNWFFSHLLQRIKYYEKLYKSGKVHPIWKKSFVDISLNDLSQLIERSREFKIFFLDKWPKSPTNDRVMHLIKKIEEIHQMVVANSPSAESVESLEAIPSNPIEENQSVAEAPLPEDFSKIKNDEQENEINIVEESTAPVWEDFTQNSQILEEFVEETVAQEEIFPPKTLFQSPPKRDVNEEADFLTWVEMFSRKLTLFESFISKNDYLKAAVVAKDIDYLIQTFDPLDHFPKMFAKYFSLFAKHVAALSEQYNKDSLQVKTLEKLYRTDVDMFVEW